MRARFPLNGNLNYSYNGRDMYPPKDTALRSKSLSAIAGWQLQEETRTPNISTAGYTNNGNVPQGFVVDSVGSALPYVFMKGNGGYSGTPGVLGVMSGVLGTSHTPNLATFVDVTDRQTPANLRPLTPADSYQISFEASGRSAANDKICYAVFNQTAQKHWVEPTGQWRDIETTYSSNLVNVMTSSVGSPDGWHLYKGIITPSSTFLQNDNYQLIVAPGRKGTPGVTSTHFRVRNIKVENHEQGITNITAGRQGNKLFKDEQYLLGINARVARIAAAQTYPNERLYVRVVTDPKPFVGNGWTPYAKNWYYDWDSKSWAESVGASPQSQWKVLPLDSSSIEPTRHVLEFNTLNSRTPLKYHSLSKDGPLGGYFASAGPVHDDQTVYYVEVGKPDSTGEFNGVTLLGIDIINKRYNVYADDYSKKDFVDIFDFFDDLNISKSSRDARDSSSTYLLSGGSRSEYLEYWGGSHSATNGTYGFREND